MADINAKIAAEEQAARDARAANERAQALKQKQKDLEDASARARRKASQPTSSSFMAPTPPMNQPSTTQRSVHITVDSTPQPGTHASAPNTSGGPKSSSQEEWERQKRVEGANNDSIDSIMNMIGLEDVKSQVLKIKHKIDVVKRQNATLNDERFNIVLQGNPGTGTFYSISLRQG
jgi:hypothetical protein